MSNNKPNTIAERLSKGLQEYAAQLDAGDPKKIAAITGFHPNTIYPYLKGEVAIIDNGLTVLGAMKQIILEREKALNKAIA